MEKFTSQDPPVRTDEKLVRLRREDRVSREEPFSEHVRASSSEEILERHLRERDKTAARRKWTGRIMILFGLLTMLGSCPFYALALVPGQSVAAGLAIMIVGLVITAGGGALLAWRPRLKNTNEALLVALKHGNRLTVARLALDMDISFQKAESIIQELVRRGIAEIDLDDQDPDHSIVYKIRGV